MNQPESETSIAGHVYFVPVELFTFFLIYTIWKHSPDKMQNYKYFVMKMTSTDLIFSFVIGHLFQPVLLFPLPGATAIGLLQFAGPIGGKIAYALVLAAGLTTLYSVNDCCIARCMIIYGRSDWLEMFKGNLGMTYMTCLYLISYAGIYGIVFLTTTEYSGLVLYAKRHKLEEYLVGTYEKMSLIAFNLDNSLILYLSFCVCAWLIGTEAINVVLSWAVQRRLNMARASMSKETFKMQKALTIMLLFQMIIPFVSLSIPVAVYGIAFVTETKAIYDSQIILLFSTMLIGGYPLLNNLCCFIMIKPYRTYAKELLSKIFPWITVLTPVTPLTSHAASSMLQSSHA